MTDWAAKSASLCSFKTSLCLSSEAPSRKSIKKNKIPQTQGIRSVLSSIKVINSHGKICVPWFVAEGFSGHCSWAVFPNPEPRRDKESCIPLSRLAAKQRPEEEPEGCIFSPDGFCLVETGNFRHFTSLQRQTCEILNLLQRTPCLQRHAEQNSFQYFVRKWKIHNLRISTCFPRLKNYILQTGNNKNTAVIIKENLLYGKVVFYIFWCLSHLTSVIKEKINWTMIKMKLFLCCQLQLSWNQGMWQIIYSVLFTCSERKDKYVSM